MTIGEKIVHTVLISFLFSVICWLITNYFVISLTFIKYFFIEIILIISLKVYKFTISKLGLN
jgi:hypothetical protein